MCLYVCICVCMYVCMSVCLSVCMYVCMSVCIYVCMHACMDGWMHACMYVRMYVSRILYPKKKSYGWWLDYQMAWSENMNQLLNHWLSWIHHFPYGNVQFGGYTLFSDMAIWMGNSILKQLSSSNWLRFFLGNIEAYSSEPSYLLDRYGNPGFWFGTCGINHDLFHHYWVFRQFHLFSLLGMGWNWVISAATGWGHRTWNFGDFTTEDAGFAQKENGSLHTFISSCWGGKQDGGTNICDILVSTVKRWCLNVNCNLSSASPQWESGAVRLCNLITTEWDHMPSHCGAFLQVFTLHVCIGMYWVSKHVQNWRFPKMGVPPTHLSHGWPWLRIETYGDLGIPHDLRKPHMPKGNPKGHQLEHSPSSASVPQPTTETTWSGRKRQPLRSRHDAELLQPIMNIDQVSKQFANGQWIK